MLISARVPSSRGPAAMAQEVRCLKAQLEEKEKEIAALKSKLARLGKVREV